ncbi:MAG: efflux RND transporter periplasmic adaptor subunit [Burkholderiales bacterium]|nr:efflux RND transporter periplasmic adaptor subunit [Burkholderiales bacterium]
MTRRQWLALAVLLAAVALALAWAFAPRPAPVEVAAVARGAFEQIVEEDGKTRVRERYVVSAPLAGRLARIALEPGDAVKAGATVAVLYPADPSLLDPRTTRELEERVGAAQAALEQARAESARAEIALAQAKIDAARDARLAKEGFLSQSAREKTDLDLRLKARMLEAARFAQQGAEHGLAQARAALLRARDLPAARSAAARWPISSPVAGRVLRVLQKSETVVAIGTPLVELADPAALEIVVDVLSADATRIAPGATVAIDAGAGYALAGRVRMVEPGAFTKVSALGVEEQRVNVLVDFTSAPESVRGLGDGYRVDVRITTFEKADAVTVPVSALFREDGDWKVFAASDGRAHKRAVKIGGRNPVSAWVESGLEPGERVIVYPGDSVAEGSRVEIVRGP